MKKFAIGSLLFLLVSSVCMFSASAEEAKENLLTVNGDYTVVTTADEAYVSIGVRTNNPDYKLCQEENKTKMNQITAAIKSIGIDEKYIKTTQYESIPIYDYIKTEKDTGEFYNGTYNNKRVFKEYQLTHMIQVMLTDVSLVGKVVDMTVEKGVNELNNVQFAISKPKQHQLYLEALAGASKRAKDKAEVLKNAFGISSLKIRTISANDSIPYNNYSYNSYAAPKAAAFEDSNGGGNYTSITSGELKVSASVSIVYTY